MDADRWERKRQRWEQRWERRMERRRNRWNHPGRHLFSGVVFVAIGLAFLLGNMGFLNIDVVFRFWPVLLIAAGIFKFVESHDENGGPGVFLIIIGSLFLMDNFSVLRIIFHNFWPLVLIGVGCTLLWRSMEARRQREESGESGTSGSTGTTGTTGSTGSTGTKEEPAGAGESTTSSNSILSVTAILGGVAKRNNSQDFRGGDVTSIMGGSEIDLRSASITPPHEAVLEVFAMWGGIVVRVPPDWTVISQVFPILGGFADKTTPPRDESKRLVIRGTVVMGGVEVKN